jgi:CheY-like chemotaxis protein
VDQKEVRTGHVTRRRTSFVHVHDLEVPLVLAVRAAFRDLLHVDLELLPAAGAQNDPFAHESASFRFKQVRYRISASNDGNRGDIRGKDGTGAMEPAGRERDGRSGTILLVEDSDVVREVIARMLEGGGFTILAASGGEDALSISRRKDVSIDLLLTDIVMPEMTGVELAERMGRERPDMRILFMTGYNEETVVNEGILGTRRDCIGKPFTREQITTRVRKLLFP